MMSSQELNAHFAYLGLSQTDASRLLGVVPRTVSRWIGGEEVPGAVEQALRAWRRLHERGLAWRPDTVALFNDDPREIAAHRHHTVELDAVLTRVDARGGPRFPWEVDRESCRATYGAMEVSFHKLANGGFSLNTYTRKDTYPDVQRDQELIDDAIYCIAKEMRKERIIPVTLVYMDAPNFTAPGGQFGTMRHEEFPSNAEALERVFRLMDKSIGHSFTIRTGTTNEAGDFLWNEAELRAEYDRRCKAGRFRRRV